MEAVRKGNRRVSGILAWTTAAIVLLALAVPPRARAQGAFMTIHACRRIDIRQVVQGSQVIYTQCGSQFSAADPYIAVVAHLRQIRSRTTFLVELLDPDQIVVWTQRGTIAPPEGQDIIYSDLWLWGLLPLSADLSRLVAENPRFVFGVIRLSGKPARDRVGEWTLRAVLNNGIPHVAKFTLSAVPGAAPTPGPTPTPSPAPESSPSPSP